MKRIAKRYYALMAFLFGFYVALSIINRPTQAMLERYNLTEAKAFLIIFSLDLFLGFIWFLAAYGFVQTLAYSYLIRGNRDGKAMQKIAWGLGVIAFRQPVTSAVSAVFNYFIPHHPDLAAQSVIVVNYIGVLGAVVGFSLISMGASQLVEITRKRPPVWTKIIFMALSIVIISIYTYLAIGRGGYQTPLTTGGRANFYLPSWLIVSTIIVPYAYSWFVAFLAIYDLLFYGRYVKGALYKKALRWLSAGITVVVFNTIVLQFISARNAQLNKLNVVPLLLLVYVLLISLAIGFVIVAVGAKKLRRIEEV